MRVLRSVRDRIGRRVAAGALGLAAVAVVVPSAALVGAPAAGAVTSCTTSWKAPGTSGSFTLTKNWTNGVPSTGSDACLPASATAYTVTEHGSASVHSLTVGAGATLHMESTPNASVLIQVGAGGVANSGTIELVNTDPAGRTTTLEVIGASIENDGTVRVLPSGGSPQNIDAHLHNTAMTCRTTRT